MIIHQRQYIPLVLFIVLLVLSFFIIKSFLQALFLSALIAYIFHPLYRRLLRLVRKPTIASILVCLLVFLLLVVPAIFFVNMLVKESYVSYIVIKQKLAVGIFKDCTNSFCESLKGLVHDPDINLQVQKAIKAITTWFIEKGSQLVFSLPRLFLNLFVMFFALFYFLKEGEQFLQRLNEYLFLHRQKYELLLSRLKEIIHGVVFGYFVIALIQGALGALGFFLFGISSPLFWGLLMALLALIPYLGTGLVWVPAAAFLFLEGVFQDSQGMMIKGIALFLYGLILIAGIDNVLKPKLIGEKAKIHPAIIMIGIFGGLLWFGPLGVIIGPLLLSLTAVVIETYVVKKERQS